MPRRLDGSTTGPTNCDDDGACSFDARRLPEQITYSIATAAAAETVVVV